MPPKKNPGARRRGTTLSLNEFLRHDDDSNPTDPTCDPNPPMATNGSSRSRNDQPSNRSCNNARRNVGKLSPSAVGLHRSNPFNPTDTKPPMATYGSNRSRNSAHQYNDQTSIAAVGSNRSGNKSRRNGDRPSASAVGSNRSGNKSRRNGDRPSASAVGSNRSRRESNPPNPTDTNPQSHQFGGPAGSNGSDNRTLQNYENPKMPNTAELGYNQLFRPGVQLTQIFGYTIAANPDQLLNSPTPEPTDTDPPMAANGASFSSINTPQNDAPPETSADGNENLSNVGDDDILRQRFSQFQEQKLVEKFCRETHLLKIVEGTVAAFIEDYRRTRTRTPEKLLTPLLLRLDFIYADLLTHAPSLLPLIVEEPLQFGLAVKYSVYGLVRDQLKVAGLKPIDIGQLHAQWRVVGLPYSPNLLFDPAAHSLRLGLSLVQGILSAYTPTETLVAIVPQLLAAHE
ncbi:sporozoite surface protein 2-like isoform X3 [Drosophila miranda]|uniref:sporozoite surface protein 2-like isoform X3 n=1 Tax=Drosophila miranda TaxID=7229 RepID=UPI00143FA4B0|nr:sporozoite surface protein 2-like isoform X3 [Drosophila miranda]